MTSAPADLLAFRADLRAITGLGAVELGIVGDGAHQRTGGYHEGKDVLTSIGRYHGPASANVGSSAEDYSARVARDRNGLTNSSSATDIGSAWRNGGRPAWLRFNNALYQEMRDRPANLPALRAINVSLDGKTRRRYDQHNRGAGLVSSTDTVDTHTHCEFWRDTEGRRASTLARIVQLAQAAVSGTTPAASTGDDMEQTEKLSQGNPGYAGHQLATAWAFTWEAAAGAKANTDRLLVAAQADADRDAATLAAINAIAAAIKAGGGNVDAAPIVAAVKAAADESRAQYTTQLERIAELEAELAEVKAAAEANLSPAERAALDKP